MLARRQVSGILVARRTALARHHQKFALDMLGGPYQLAGSRIDPWTHLRSDRGYSTVLLAWGFRRTTFCERKVPEGTASVADTVAYLPELGTLKN